jgi:hypothetical protein
MNKTQIQSAVKLEIQLDKARKQVAALEEQIAQIRLEALRQVEMVKNDSSITLLFKGRRINARKNTHNRYVVKEGKTTLKNEYYGGIHDLRFDIARGVI